MKATDYMIEFFISKGVTDIFGYPGGVICHLMDSAQKYSKHIKAHTNYHEQGASFAACGYAQSSKKIGVAYATSGPGATNLITGIANAYFDSIPTIFITGQVDTYAIKGKMKIRQRGFQETNVISMVSEISKYSVFVESIDNLKYYLEKAYWMATSGRQGPVVLDIPADIQRADADFQNMRGFSEELEENRIKQNDEQCKDYILKQLKKAKRPCFLIGAGVKQAGQETTLIEMINEVKVPTVFSMPAFDILPYEHPYNFGFIGGNGHRFSNFILAKSDLIISIGSRLDLKQVGAEREKFAEKAQLIRIDIDQEELCYTINGNEKQFISDIKSLLPELNILLKENSKYFTFDAWISVCNLIKEKLMGCDDEIYHKCISRISDITPAEYNVTADVGHNQVWVAQAFHTKDNQAVYMSGGHGAMGYSLPASIGVHYGSKKPVLSFNGDGGFQMNIQEIQFIKRENLPIKIIILNNYSLGMIRQFQEKNFDEKYVQTTENSGYLAPEFSKIAFAYGLEYIRIETVQDADKINFSNHSPTLIEVCIDQNTYITPNFGRNRPLQDQEPLIERELYKYLMEL